MGLVRQDLDAAERDVRSGLRGGGEVREAVSEGGESRCFVIPLAEAGGWAGGLSVRECEGSLGAQPGCGSWRELSFSK